VLIYFGYDMQEHSCQQLDNSKFKYRVIFIQIP
jgi:hypothetical protein